MTKKELGCTNCHTNKWKFDEDSDIVCLKCNVSYTLNKNRPKNKQTKEYDKIKDILDSDLLIYLFDALEEWIIENDTLKCGKINQFCDTVKMSGIQKTIIRQYFADTN